jgi:CRP/FNR family transcriptional regulator
MEIASQKNALPSDDLTVRVGRQIEDKARTPYGLKVISSCLGCQLVNQRAFCQLPQPALAEMDAISSSSVYPKGAILFVEGQDPRGVFVVCNGRLKLSTSSSQGKSVIVRVAESGEVIGLPATLSGKPYDLTAEALEPVQANFIHRGAFLAFLHHHADAAVRVAEILSQIYHNTLSEVRYLGLSASTPQRLARFLLDQSQENSRSRLTLTLTHREMADIIGSSRETITRLFARFRTSGWIEVRGSALILKDRRALEQLRDS